MYRLRALAMVGALGLSAPALAWSAEPQWGPQSEPAYAEGYDRGARAGAEDYRRATGISSTTNPTTAGATLAIDRSTAAAIAIAIHSGAALRPATAPATATFSTGRPDEDGEMPTAMGTATRTATATATTMRTSAA
jgi:hypothetical protein